MSHRVRLAVEAKSQIREICKYIRQDSPENSRRWRQKLLTHIRSLEHFPERHEIAYTEDLVGRTIRHTFLGNFRVLYVVEGDSVVVVTVRHGARRPLGPDEVRRLT